MIICKICKIEKQPHEIQWNSSGRGCYCKECNNRRGREHYRFNKKQKQINGLKQNYNISLEEYNKLLEIQNSVCAICKKICKTGRSLSVDHNHKTGKNRGLLCQKCNSILGFMDEDINLLEIIRDYLIKHSDIEKELIK